MIKIEVTRTGSLKIAFEKLLILIMCFLFAGCHSVAEDVANQRQFLESEMVNLNAQAEAIIRKSLADANPQIRTIAVEIVSSIPENAGQRFMPAVQKLLYDEDSLVRFAAAVAIGDTVYRPAKNDVLKLLKDADQNVRLAANYAAFKLVPGVTTDTLHTALSSPDQLVRANAAFLLGKTGNAKEVPFLYEVIRDESSDDRVRFNAAEAIARLGDNRIYSRLWAMLISAYADDRVFGIRAMGALNTPQARDALLTMLKDDIIEVRLVAAEQLGTMKDTAGEKTVLDALAAVKSSSQIRDREEKARVLTLCAKATGQIRTLALKKYLPELIKNEAIPVRLAAAGAVFQCGSSDNIGR